MTFFMRELMRMLLECNIIYKNIYIYIYIKAAMPLQCFGIVHSLCLHCASIVVVTVFWFREPFFIYLFLVLFGFFVFSFFFIYSAIGLVNRHWSYSP